MLSKTTLRRRTIRKRHNIYKNNNYSPKFTYVFLDNDDKYRGGVLKQGFITRFRLLMARSETNKQKIYGKSEEHCKGGVAEALKVIPCGNNTSII